MNVDSLTIGSGFDQKLRLDDVYVTQQYAEITLGRGLSKGPVISAIDGGKTGGVSVNNKLVQRAKLRQGDVLNFGTFDITIQEPASGKSAQSPLRISIEKKAGGAPATRTSQRRTSLRIEDTWLNKRKWSVRFFAFIMVFFLLLPLVGFFFPFVANTLRDLPVIPSDNSWESGKLAKAHHIPEIDKNCNVCHEKAFIIVKDSSCLKCHKNIQEHIKPELYAKNEVDNKHCETCHKDHNGIEHDLIDNRDALCLSCHHKRSEESDQVAGKKIRDINDLDESHPEFKVSLVKYNQAGKAFHIERHSLTDIAILKEESNLFFPHDKHLQTDGIEGKNKKGEDITVKMECSDCHTLSLSGANFKPISRKKHCQDCHLLTFEPDDPDQEVVHGAAEQVLPFLEGYYSNRALAGIAKAPLPQRYRPGMTLSAAQKTTIRKWAIKKAGIANEELFTSTACTVCHKVSKKKEYDKGMQPWEILPVKITESWLPKAKLFDHKKHAQTECTLCHNKEIDASKVLAVENENESENESADAKDDSVKEDEMGDTQLASGDSFDVLMPQIAICKECHTSQNISGKVKASCVDCHGFHINDEHQMGAKEEMSNASH